MTNVIGSGVRKMTHVTGSGIRKMTNVVGSGVMEDDECWEEVRDRTETTDADTPFFLNVQFYLNVFFYLPKGCGPLG
jgi:hypothetical protein